MKQFSAWPIESTRYTVNEFGRVNRIPHYSTMLGPCLSVDLREKTRRVTHTPLGAQSPLLGLGQGFVPTAADSHGIGHRLHGVNRRHNLLVILGLGLIMKQAEREAPRPLFIVRGGRFLHGPHGGPDQPHARDPVLGPSCELSSEGQGNGLDFRPRGDQGRRAPEQRGRARRGLTGPT